MTLLNDVTRCQGRDCGLRETCARYVLRSTGGERTPQTERVCGLNGSRIVDGFIEIEKEAAR